ncbi:hypothetical protein HNV12_01030 [Methanococcoides sp. SA1]|nr:hypothetical protein [Methanococcoides sp. SA1]
MDEKDLRILDSNMKLGCTAIMEEAGYQSNIEKLLGGIVCVADSTFQDPVMGRPTAVNLDGKTYVVSSNGKKTLMRYENIQVLYFLGNNSF